MAPLPDFNLPFNPAMFDNFFPDEEGPVEARKRLLEHGKHFCRVRRYSLDQWKNLVMKDSETRYYAKLIGGSLYLHHLGMWIWQPLSRRHAA